MANRKARRAADRKSKRGRPLSGPSVSLGPAPPAGGARSSSVVGEGTRPEVPEAPQAGAAPWRLSADALDSVRSLVRKRAGVDRALARAVEVARSSGASWDEIASALGVRRQSAWERYGKG